MIAEELEIQIKEDLVKHEGCKTDVYLCSENIPTAGIGHMLTEEYGLAVGDSVPMETVLEWFDVDYKEAVADCVALLPSFSSLPDQVKRVLVNMAFNLGRSRLGKFKKMLEAVEAGDWIEAANQMVDSRWYNQVGGRSIELENWMRNA